jgi:RHH-type transcriptional regulator, proline utilization regulon repressor / proline dehydrogenase / delta 1-pyrroline-5-carboxylate dehydrogenase
MNSLQPEIEAAGLKIFDAIRGETPRAFSRGSLTGRLLDWSMRNEALKVQLFRLVDVLPTLRSPQEIASHAYEYLAGTDGALPGPVRWAVRLAPKFPWLTAFAARKGIARMARTFILADDARQAVPSLREMRNRPLAFTVDILGETAVSEREAEDYQRRYLELIETLAAEAAIWPDVEQIDSDAHGSLPKVNVSVKISALYSQIVPSDPEGSIEQLASRLRPLLLRAKELGVFINFDMEHYALKDLTLELFKRLLDEPSLRDYERVGLALQAYLRDSEDDLRALIEWARTRKRHITIRLIKGAYWDYETTMAAQRGWPVPVFERKHETDANFEKLARIMLENEQWVRCAFGTHNVRSIAACMVLAEKLEVPKSSYEFQMLYGMAEPIKGALIKMGCRLRDYSPVGELLPAMSYLVRRLLENTSNEGFLRATFSEHTSPRKLLRDPAADSHARSRLPRPNSVFENEPHTDFAVASNRSRMAQALVETRPRLGQRHPLVIGGQPIFTEREITSINPARPAELVGVVAQGDKRHAEAALAAAQSAFRTWSRTPVNERAQVLEAAARIMRAERFELAAVEVFETGKNWSESDADIAEAIDFCDFYAQEMRRIASARYVVPGELNIHHYVPRGIGVIIAPWNFPLAILCGMTVAAVVCGNCVIVKPSEQSPVIASRFVEILQRAGLPAGVVNFLPGPGSQVGAYLVEHSQIAFIAFTGSREVGLRIYETAGRTLDTQLQLKKVVCEMGGKNALIIDSDADLDEAIPAAIYSAFGYAGQKCSALSRLIVLDSIYNRALDRLIDACRSLCVGAPDDPATIVGPVIDKDAYDRIRKYIDIGKSEAMLAYQGTMPAGDGYFIPPTIFVDVPPRARIAQEEIFGPVLSVFRASDLDHALALANDCRYALTGGIFSRSPANIERAKAEMQVGNLYINRTITGALVARHPFGGFKMSGGGTKAGGRDYLQNFLFPRSISENTMRRGFAPEEVSSGSQNAAGE